jgi:predicted RNA-binding Zn ribbon-like protein
MAKIQTNPKGWKIIGGRPCLDFINTVGGRATSGTILRDKLIDYADLLEWAQFAAIVNQTESRSLARHAASHRRNADATLARAVLLREALYRIFKSAVEGRRPRQADLDTLSGELRIARAHECLIHTHGAFGWTWEDSEAALDRVLWPVSLSAADVLTSGDLPQLRQCDGDKCGWLFLDTSRNRSRHWCDMKDCGNRAKVRRFRTRQQRNRGHARSA